MIMITATPEDVATLKHPCPFCLLRESIRQSLGEDPRDVDGVIIVELKDGDRYYVSNEDAARLAHLSEGRSTQAFSFYLEPL